MIQAATQVHLGNIVQAEEASHKGSHFIGFHLYETSKTDLERQKIEEWLPRARGAGGTGEWLLVGTGFFLG